MIVVGEVALWLALLFAVWAGLSGALGGATGREALVASGARGLVAAALTSALAAAGVVTALVTRDYELAYAASTTSHALPTAYAAAALWSAPAGAALLLVIPLAAAGAVVAVGARGAGRPWIVALCGVVLVACLAPLAFGNALFARLPFVAADGAGLAPPLQVPWYLLHAPIAALGYALVVPHQLASLAAVVAHADDAPTTRRARRVALLGWVLLGTSILVALTWVYRDVRWWDDWPTRPVVDGSAIEWLLAGASVAVRTPRARAVLAVLTLAVITLAASVAPLGLLERADVPLRDGRGVLLGAAALALAAVAWHSAAGMAPPAPRAFRRSVRLTGFAVLAAAVACLVLALVGQRAAASRDLRLETGRATAVVDPRGATWRLTGQGASSYQSRNRDVTALAVSAARADGDAAVLTAERWQALDRRGRVQGEAVSVAGLRRTPVMDLRVALDAESEAGADVRVRFEPFAALFWIAGLLALLGGALGLVD